MSLQRQSPGREVAMVVEIGSLGAVIMGIGNYLCKERKKKNRGENSRDLKNNNRGKKSLSGI